jgi:protein-tyrosine phosphatase
MSPEPQPPPAQPEPPPRRKRRWWRFARFLAVYTFVVSGGVGLVLLIVARATREKPNYSRIEEGLYMGGRVPKPPSGTSVVLNLCEKKDPYQAEIHRWEPIPDAAPAPSIDWLRRMVAFVNTQRRGGRTTYVHCAAGVSRAGLVIVAYMMFKNNWTRDQALEFVRSRRPVTRPNPAFMQLLLEWGEVLRKDASQ